MPFVFRTSMPARRHSLANLRLVQLSEPGMALNLSNSLRNVVFAVGCGAILAKKSSKHVVSRIEKRADDQTTRRLSGSI